MKRYVVFAFNRYYPKGGWLDLQNDFLNIEDAVQFAVEITKKDKEIGEESRCHVVDIQQYKIIFEITTKDL